MHSDKSATIGTFKKAYFLLDIWKSEKERALRYLGYVYYMYVTNSAFIKGHNP